MANPNGRLLKELKEVGKEDTSGVKALPVVEGNMTHLHGTIEGPSGTPYDGGVYEIDIKIPKQYPFEPPKMKFVTKIWHPNISSQTGAICLVGSRFTTGCRSRVVFLESVGLSISTKGRTVGSDFVSLVVVEESSSSA